MSRADGPARADARTADDVVGNATGNAAYDDADLDALARRFAPVLVCSPEIPVGRSPDAALRSTWTRSDDRSASRPTDGAHMTRDFHPCDVRLILAHAQAWEPATPLPLVPTWFSRAYRDLARLFFWPITFLVVVLVLMLTFAQGLPPAAQASVELGVLVVLGIIYLVTLRSPILVPVDHWHHLNHAVIGGGLIIALGAEFGTAWLWLYGPVIVIPTVLSMLTTVALRIVSGLSNAILLLLHKVRSLFLRMRSGATRKAPDTTRTSRLFHGLKAAHEYSTQAELFYRDPVTQKPLHRSDKAAHWAAYSAIRARETYTPTCYARVLDPDATGLVAIQYWFCYYYNDWANTHEGDWESAIVFVRDGQAVGVAASQHERGEYRDCAHVRWQGERPVLYVAVGSHAMYFDVGAHLSERPIAGLQLSALDATLLGRDILDFVDFTTDADRAVILASIDVVRIPDPEQDTGRWGHRPHDPGCRGGCVHDFEWLEFAGHWGAAAVAFSPGSSGPRGPAFSGLKWDNPLIWTRTMCRPCSACNGDGVTSVEL